MHHVRSAVLTFVIALAMTPTSLAGQFVLRDDVDGWAWLALVPERDAVVQLVHGSPQRGDQARLDEELVTELRALGVRRVWGIRDFDATESYVVGECAAVDWTSDTTSDVHVGVHAEVSFWDHTKLSATEMFESLTFQAVGRDGVSDEVLVQTCVSELSDVLFRLGFNQG